MHSFSPLPLSFLPSPHVSLDLYSINLSIFGEAICHLTLLDHNKVFSPMNKQGFTGRYA